MRLISNSILPSCSFLSRLINAHPTEFVPISSPTIFLIFFDLYRFSCIIVTANHNKDYSVVKIYTVVPLSSGIVVYSKVYSRTATSS